uniref:Serpentine receptor class gamma n=1 Tax=Panagrellus redivivus TaxID=6233 RepID=A0A7E4V9R6_PANRE
MVVLVMKVIVCLCQAIALIATNIGNTTLFSTVITIYVYSGDVLNLIGPVALIAVSHHVRKDYCNFWRSVYFLKPSLFYVGNSNVVMTTKVTVIRSKSENDH